MANSRDTKGQPKNQLYSKLNNLDNIPFWGTPVVRDNNGFLSCPGFSGNTFSSNQWDYLIIGDKQTPGLCEVSSRRERSLDKKKASGSDGARLTLHGIPPAMVEIRFLIWTPDQLEKLRGVWNMVFPPSSQRPQSVQKNTPFPAFTVKHPELDYKGISQIQFVSGEGPGNGPIPRSRVFMLRGIELFLPQKKNVTSSPVQALGASFTKSVSKERSPLPSSSSRNKGPHT